MLINGRLRYVKRKDSSGWRHFLSFHESVESMLKYHDANYYGSKTISDGSFFADESYRKFAFDCTKHFVRFTFSMNSKTTSRYSRGRFYYKIPLSMVGTRIEKRSKILFWNID